MFESRKLVGGAGAVVAACVMASSAHAHFILLKPENQYMQNTSPLAGGDPQKLAPCGPGTGDPGTPTNKVLEVKAGSMLEVSWDITIPHEGYFRIALDKDPTKFTEPPYTDKVACTINLSTVPKGAHDNVLMDGIAPDALMQMVKIPDEPCDDCTLQVIQAMKDHGPPNCTYYHCAKLKILPKDGATAGAGGSAGSAGGAGGMGATGGAGGMGGMGGSAGSAGMAAAGGGGSAGMTAVAGTTGAQAGASAPPAAGAGAPAPMMMMQPVAAAGAAAPAPSSESESDSGGCAVARAGGAGVSAGWLAFGLALSAFAWRRRSALR